MLAYCPHFAVLPSGNSLVLFRTQFPREKSRYWAVCDFPWLWVAWSTLSSCCRPGRRQVRPSHCSLPAEPQHTSLTPKAFETLDIRDGVLEVYQVFTITPP